MICFSTPKTGKLWDIMCSIEFRGDQMLLVPDVYVYVRNVLITGHNVFKSARSSSDVVTC